MLPLNAPKPEMVTLENIKEFYTVSLNVEHQDFNPTYTIKKGKDMMDIIGSPLNENEYCIEVCFNLRQFSNIEIGQQAERSYEFKSYVFKHKNFVYTGLPYAFSSAHIYWDCTDTDISSVMSYASIENISEPRSLLPNNKKIAIVSHTPGLPGHHIIFVWRFEDP